MSHLSKFSAEKEDNGLEKSVYADISTVDSLEFARD